MCVTKDSLDRDLSFALVSKTLKVSPGAAWPQVSICDGTGPDIESILTYIYREYSLSYGGGEKQNLNMELFAL